MRALFVSIPLLLAAAGTSQEGTSRFMPENMLVDIQLDGIPELAERFAATNLGRMCKSGKWADIWARAVELVEAELEADAPLDFQTERLREILEAYSGRARLGVRAQFRVDAEEPDVTVALVLCPDSETDFEELVALVLDAVTEDGDVPISTETTPLGEVDVLSPVGDAEERVMLGVLDGHLVVAGGDLDGYLESLGQRDGAERAVTDHPFHGVFDMKQLRGLVEIASERERGGDEAVSAAAAASMIGTLFDGLDAIAFWVRPTGPYTEAAFEFRHDPAGSIIDVLKTDDDPADLLAFAPRERPSAQTWGFNLPAILEVVKKAIDAAPNPVVDDVEKGFQQATGLRLREDLIDRFEGTLMIVHDAGEFGDEPSMSFTLGLDDAAALEEVLERVLRDRGLHAGRKTKEYRGHQVRNLNLGIIALDWVFTDKHLVVGFGADGGGALRRIVDGIEARKAGLDPAEWPKGVRERLGHAGEGYQWLQVSDASDDSEVVVEALEAELSSRGAPREFIDILGDAVSLMAEYGLLTTVGTTRFTPGRLTIRQIW